MAVLIGPLGTIESLCSDGRELIDSVAPVIVTDDKWRNFDTENLQHEVEMDGSVTLTGHRSYGQQVLKFTQTMRLIHGRLRVQYNWRAHTPLRLRAFRQSVRFSPRVFGGKVIDTDKEQIPSATGCGRRSQPGQRHHLGNLADREVNRSQSTCHRPRI